MPESINSCLAAIQKQIEQNRSQMIEEYYKFLSFPSVSSEPQYKQHVQECADWLSEYIGKMDFDVEQWPTSGHPVIFASYNKAGPDKPTLLIYNHYDVQPADPLGEWTSPPFTPTLRDGTVYARGAQDNKGQCFYVLQALKFYLNHYGSLPLNIKLCIEGEEEIGSVGLAGILAQKQNELNADYLAIVDLGLRDPKVPALTLGLRGIVAMDVEVKGSNQDLHSGSHGGIVFNPLHALVALLASLHDERGKITIPEFYNQVEDLSVQERAKVSFRFDVADYEKSTGAYPVGGEKDYSILERAWIRPTLEINGIWGGYNGKGFKTVIPAKAYAKLSCRLVPQQIPQQIGELVANYLRNNSPQGIQISVTVHQGKGKAVRANSGDHIAIAFSKAFEEVFGMPAEFIFDGASIPIVTELAETCKGQVILLGLGLLDDCIHAPNEHFGLDRIEKGILIMARAFELLAGQEDSSS